MATTQSGFEVIFDYGDSRLVSNPTVPGTNVRILGGLLAGDVATVLLYIAGRWNTEIEPLVQELGQWGFEPKQITGGSGWSNHAGGCAEDLNASTHPQGERTMDDATYGRVRKIINDVNAMAGDTVVDWGGEWSGGTKDEMHVQIHGNVNTFALNRAAAAIKGGSQPTTPTSPETPDPPAEQDWFDMATKDDLREVIAEFFTGDPNSNGTVQIQKRDPDGTLGPSKIVHLAEAITQSATLDARQDAKPEPK